MLTFPNAEKWSRMSDSARSSSRPPRYNFLLPPPPPPPPRGPPLPRALARCGSILRPCRLWVSPRTWRHQNTTKGYITCCDTALLVMHNHKSHMQRLTINHFSTSFFTSCSILLKNLLSHTAGTKATCTIRQVQDRKKIISKCNTAMAC